MASNNTIKTRIQLKSDTEENWKKAGPKENSNGFVPLAGELIIYSADEAHPFSRLKVGDGFTNVNSLPFIDSGTLNGEETEIIKKATYSEFPSPGSPRLLYVDLSTNKIYHYEGNTGYTELAQFHFRVETETIKKIERWSAGRMTSAVIEDNIFKVVNGLRPDLNLSDITVVTNVTEGDEE